MGRECYVEVVGPWWDGMEAGVMGRYAWAGVGGPCVTVM